MPQIQVCFGSIIKHINFPMLVWAHGSGINIDIGIQFLYRDFIPTLFEQSTNGSGCHTFSDRADDTTREKDKFGIVHKIPPLSNDNLREKGRAFRASPHNYSALPEYSIDMLHDL
jgi:hypothetical protein